MKKKNINPRSLKLTTNAMNEGSMSIPREAAIYNINLLNSLAVSCRYVLLHNGQVCQEDTIHNE